MKVREDEKESAMCELRIESTAEKKRRIFYLGNKHSSISHYAFSILDLKFKTIKNSEKRGT
jgi:hypothetical protein